MAESISIVVPTYNRPQALARLLESLRSEVSALPRVEVVVVDDGSTFAGNRALVEQFGHRCIEVPNGGAASARNVGWRAVSGDIVVFVDDDVVATPGWLTALVAPLVSPDVVAVGGGIKPFVPGGLATFVQAERLVDHAVADDGKIRYLVSANVAFRRTALHQVGGFATEFPGAAGEDVDLSLRVQRVGRLALAPDAVVLHDHRTAFRELLRTYYGHGRGRRILAERHATLSRREGATRVLRLQHWRDRRRCYLAAGVSPVIADALLVVHAACLVAFLLGVVRSPPSPVPRVDVVLLNDIGEMGGGQKVTLDVAQMLCELGLEVLVASPLGWLADRCADDGRVKHVRFDFGDRRMLIRPLRVPNPIAVVRRIREARSVRSLMARSGATTLHTFATIPHLVGSLASISSGWSLVWHLNQVGPAGLAALPLPDRCLAPSDAALAPLGRRPGFSARSVVCPNRVDARFAPAGNSARKLARAEFGIGEDQLAISCAARLEPLKGLHVLIEAAAEVPDAVVLIAGASFGADDGRYERRLESDAQRLGVNLRLLGARPDIERILWASDVAVLPSLWEGFGLFAAEAGRAGVPVVASDTGGIPEVVLDGRTGLLVPPGDVPALRRALLALASDPDRRAAMGAVASEVCRTRFDGSQLLSVLQSLYG